MELSEIAPWLIGALVTVGLVVIRWWIPRQTHKYFSKLVKLALNPSTDDPQLRALIENVLYHNVMLVEYLTPDAGLGKEKKARLLKALEKIVGKEGAKLLSEAIDLTVSSADVEMKELAAEAKRVIESRGKK